MARLPQSGGDSGNQGKVLNDYSSQDVTKCYSAFKDRNSRNGFTIVELLIVIVVIGILAAIVIVAFNGIQNRANDTAVKSDLVAISKKIDIYKTDAPTYPNGGQLAPLQLKASKNAYATNRNNIYYCKYDTAERFAVTAQSKSGKMFAYISGSGLSEISNTTGSATTCDLIGTPSGTNSNAVGYDFSGTTGWAT